MFSGCTSLNPFKGVDKGREKITEEISISNKSEKVQIAYWKDRALHSESKTAGLSANKAMGFYVSGVIAIGIGIFLFTVPLKNFAMGAVGLGLVCLAAPATIAAMEGVGETIGTVIKWTIWLVFGGGVIYVVWMLKARLKQSINIGQKAKKILQQKLTKADYEKAKEIIQQGVEPCKIIAKIKGK